MHCIALHCIAIALNVRIPKQIAGAEPEQAREGRRKTRSAARRLVVNWTETVPLALEQIRRRDSRRGGALGREAVTEWITALMVMASWRLFSPFFFLKKYIYLRPIYLYFL